MGLAIKELLTIHPLEFSDLKNKVVTVDSFNLLYQFLTTIRSRDGSLLKDSHGQVTSHLVGLLARTTKWLDYGIKPVFVFDGKPPKLKTEERERRRDIKIKAQKKYEVAAKKKDFDDMKKYASMTTRLTKDMVDESKKLLTYLGLPVVQAKSEGEAQASYIVSQGDAYAVVSQDFDSLLHGATNLVRNLSIAGKRKRTNKLQYETISPELIKLSENLNHLKVDQNQLIVLAILVGTDYNHGGVKGIGPKSALKLLHTHGTDFDALFKSVKWDTSISWEEIYYTIKKMPVEQKYSLSFTDMNVEKLKSFLVNDHDFSEDRVDSYLKKSVKSSKSKAQSGLSDFM